MLQLYRSQVRSFSAIYYQDHCCTKPNAIRTFVLRIKHFLSAFNQTTKYCIRSGASEETWHRCMSTVADLGGGTPGVRRPLNIAIYIIHFFYIEESEVQIVPTQLHHIGPPPPPPPRMDFLNPSLVYKIIHGQVHTVFRSMQMVHRMGIMWIVLVFPSDTEIA